MTLPSPTSWRCCRCRHVLDGNPWWCPYCTYTVYEPIPQAEILDPLQYQVDPPRRYMKPPLYQGPVVSVPEGVDPDRLPRRTGEMPTLTRPPGSIGMTLIFEDADPVATCHTGICRSHFHGDSVNDAVLAWTAHLAADHRSDWNDS